MKNLKTKLSLVIAFVLAFALALGVQSMAAAANAEEAKESVLTYEGMLARTVEDAGIRSLFSIDKAALAVLENDGYTVEIGALMGLAFSEGETYNAVSDLTVTKKNDTEGYIAAVNNATAVVVYSSANAQYASNKYVSETASQYTFAYTTIFKGGDATAKNYGAEFCYRGFVVASPPLKMVV